MGWWFWLPNHQVDLACIGALFIALVLFQPVFQRCVLAPIGERLAERNLERLIETVQLTMYGCPECRHPARQHFTYMQGCTRSPCGCTRSLPWLEERGFHE